MEFENVPQVIPQTGKRPPLGWNIKFGKNGHQRIPRIPIDNSVYARSGDGYVLAHDSQYENPLFIDKWLKKDKQKGWSYKIDQDLDGDGNLDTVIYNDSGKPMFWNGFHYVDKYPMLEREKFMMDPENSKYDYMMSKYKYDIKSAPEKVLTDVSKQCHEVIKELVKNMDSKLRKIVLSDLSSQFFKSFLKEGVLAPNFVENHSVCTREQYANELLEAAKGFDADKNYKMGKHRELMKIFKLVSKEMENLKNVEQLNDFRNILLAAVPAKTLNEIYKAYLTTKFTQGGDKLRLIVQFI